MANLAKWIQNNNANGMRLFSVHVHAPVPWAGKSAYFAAFAVVQISSSTPVISVLPFMSSSPSTLLNTKCSSKYDNICTRQHDCLSHGTSPPTFCGHFLKMSCNGCCVLT